MVRRGLHYRGIYASIGGKAARNPNSVNIKGINKMGKVAFAGPCIMEFGWEIMTWVPYLRKLSHDYEKMYISTFPGMEALYTGFHCEVEFIPHEYPDRTDDWMNSAIYQYDPDHWHTPDSVTDHIRMIKRYKVDGEYVRYGSPVIPEVGVLFHARGIDRFSFKNWPVGKWEQLAKGFPGVISIGTKDDLHVPGTRDCKGAALGELMDCIASAAIVIGQSSGLMHLASLCGTPQLVWADNKTYFNEPLEKRYKETWNPFNTRVTWIDCDNWNPDPQQILDALKPKIAPTPQVLSTLEEAAKSGHYIVATAWMEDKDGKAGVRSNCEPVNFPGGALDKAGELLTASIRSSIAKAQAERIPRSWQ